MLGILSFICATSKIIFIMVTLGFFLLVLGIGLGASPYQSARPLQVFAVARRTQGWSTHVPVASSDEDDGVWSVMRRIIMVVLRNAGG